MDATTCTGCNKPLTGAEILYTSTGAPICQACSDLGELRQGGATGAVREYEFDGAENEVITSLASPMRIVGVMSAVFGLVYLAYGLLVAIDKDKAGIATMVEGVLLALVGFWLLPAAGALRDIVNTEGNDVSNLMYALKKLRKVYTLQAVVWLIAVVLIGVQLMIALGNRHN